MLAVLARIGRSAALKLWLSDPSAIMRCVGTFVALDFETASDRCDSACALAIVRVEGTRIAATASRLIRPPARTFEFTHIHGIAWSDVEGQAMFAEVWRSMAPLLDGAEFIAAHNAPFDRDVLVACCAAAGFAPPALPFTCTVQLARKHWNIYPTRLPDVCRRLGIPLKHHDALSDALACAQIVLAAKAPVGKSR